MSEPSHGDIGAERKNLTPCTIVIFGASGDLTARKLIPALYNLAVLGWFLLCAGALYIIVWDQRYRCRICLRRLRMPVETGSWGRMLQFGRPRIEYICPYGHGTLKQDELQISGLENPRWTPHSGDIWDELCAASKESDNQP